MNVAQLLLFLNKSEQAVEYVCDIADLEYYEIKRLVTHLPKDFTNVQKYLIYIQNNID